jgi:hypothetical protein
VLLAGVEPDDPGFSATPSSNIVSGATGSTVDVTVRAPIRSGQTPSGYVWYPDYPEPDVPPHNEEEEIWFEARLSGGVSGVGTVAFRLVYVPDIGVFNLDLEGPWWTFDMHKRAATPPDWQWESHSNSTYTSLVQSGSVLIDSSLPTTVLSYWLRGRPDATQSWQNVGELPWSDPR